MFKPPESSQAADLCDHQFSSPSTNNTDDLCALVTIITENPCHLCRYVITRHSVEDIGLPIHLRFVIDSINVIHPCFLIWLYVINVSMHIRVPINVTILIRVLIGVTIWVQSAAVLHCALI
ncbi:hypothetical protein BJ138DRAFT_1147352 [Hygrophoropsis aurantiaca]|uniref:Uncharacterized protein n=1 Tax=Hygrophoropsis aurantiaca TaxID=72124 RepID=A0ACB8AI40_9AGAM|nr:hypothetical protein BJ138DRAFT_1147352 [Hygrophoropsis aurantiaca]